MSSYFINGNFWQELAGLDIAQLPTSGAVLVENKERLDVLFHGFIGKEKWSQGSKPDVDGFMSDIHGLSLITEFELTGPRLIFKKRYLPQQHTISYRLVRDTVGIFRGMWKIALDEHVIATDFARCMLTQIPDSFFTEPGKPI